jgi:hypothetical protein
VYRLFLLPACSSVALSFTEGSKKYKEGCVGRTWPLVLKKKPIQDEKQQDSKTREEGHNCSVSHFLYWPAFVRRKKRPSSSRPSFPSEDQLDSRKETGHKNKKEASVQFGFTSVLVHSSVSSSLTETLTERKTGKQRLFG